MQCVVCCFEGQHVSQTSFRPVGNALHLTSELYTTHWTWFSFFFTCQENEQHQPAHLSHSWSPDMKRTENSITSSTPDLLKPVLRLTTSFGGVRSGRAARVTEREMRSQECLLSGHSCRGTLRRSSAGVWTVNIRTVGQPTPGYPCPALVIPH